MDAIDKTLGQILDELAVNNADEIAVDYDDRPFCRTWKELNAECDNLARGLLSLGVKKGDHVAVWATNIPEWLTMLFAVAKIGGVVVTVNTNYKVFELEYLLKQSDSKVLMMMKGFKDCSYVDIVNTLCPELGKDGPGTVNSARFPRLKNVIFAGDDCPENYMPFNQLFQLADGVDEDTYKALSSEVKPSDVVNIQYTSGTTGFPKGVMLTHYNILNNGKAIGDCMRFTNRDKLLITVPYFHCFGLVLGLMACITHATGFVPVESYRPTTVMQAIHNKRCTACHGVPTMFIAMLEHPDFKNYDFSSLRTGIMAGSPCPVKTMQQVVDEMNMKEITIVYGQTEASPGCTQTTTDDSLELRVSTVGRVLPGVEAKIVDENGNTLPAGVPGEFCARGYNIMQGYYKMPAATAQAIDEDGWLHTGDIATVDENGYYKIVGRIKDMIIRGGENIYPKELEEFIYTHPAVSDVQVIGVPSKQYGEEVMAVIILKDGETMTEQELKAFVKANMARHKVPKYVRFVDSFPMTASGKIQKFKMREEAIEYLNLHEDANIETA